MTARVTFPPTRNRTPPASSLRLSLLLRGHPLLRSLFFHHLQSLVPAGTLLLRRSEGNSEVLYKERYILLQIGTIRGSLVYFGGFVLIVLNYGLFGALAQMAGFILIFRTFLP